MRTAVLILGPLAVLGGAFYFVMLRDRPSIYVDPKAAAAATQPVVRRMVPTTLATPDSRTSVVGPSAGVWVQTLNRKTHKLASKFRAQRFDPRPDGAVDVISPQAQFFGATGSVVMLDGTSGKVTLSEAGDKSDPNAIGTSTPTEGELQDVIVRFFEHEGDAEPIITVHVPAIHFDAVANRIATIDSVVNGQGVMADQVPVQVRGRDFDLDGRGLAMQWNDRDGRLDNLEIDHGDRLLLKNVQRFGGDSFSNAAPVRRPTEPHLPAFAFNPATALFGVVAPAAPVAAPTTAPKPQAEMYHATFDRDVRVSRDGQQLAAADVMKVVLPLGDAKPDKAAMPGETPAAQPAASAPAGAPKPKDKSSAKPRSATHETAGDSAAVRGALPPPPATTGPTTAPSPVEVRWTGKLTLRPVALMPDVSREQMVELVGTPAWVSENGGRVDARLIHVEPDSGRVRVEPGGSVKAISVKDPSGAELRSRSPLLIDRTAGTAEVSGGGTLITPPQAGSTSKSSTTVSWNKKLTANLGDGDHPALRKILIDGNAAVRSEQLTMTSQTLALAFDAPQTDQNSPTPPTDSSRFAMPSPDIALLRTVDANGTAKMDVGDAATKRSLAGDHIRISLVAGDKPSTAAVTSINSVGNVSLVDAKGLDLTCGTLDVKTKPMALGLTPSTQPTTKPSTDVSTSLAPQPSTKPTAKQSPFSDGSIDSILSLVATDSVKVKQADGSSGAGDRMELAGEPAADGTGRRMVLTGVPATVSSERGSLEGARIELDPKSGDVNVPTPGRFTGSDPKKPDSTMSIAWADSMNADGGTGICNLLGGVNINGSNPDGTHLQATAKRGVINFTTKKNAPTTEPTTRAADPAMSGITLDSIRSVRLSDDVDVSMNAQQIRTSSIQTQTIDIDLEAGIVTAPQAGRMLMIDHRPTPATMPTTGPTTESTTAPTTEAAAPTTPSTAGDMLGTSQPTPADAPASSGPSKFGPGTLALSWNESLIWKLHEGDMHIDGGVRVGFEREGTNDPVRVTCDHLICGLSPIQTAKGAQQLSQRVELRTVKAQDNVVVRSKQASFDATTLTFDALTNRATATGNPESPVDVYDADGTSHLGFSAITWNLANGMIEDFRDIDGRIRR